MFLNILEYKDKQQDKQIVHLPLCTHLNRKNIFMSNNKLGIVFGTFAPMHTGHVDLITKAKRENDRVLVIVSGTNTERDRGTKVGLHLDRRFRYVREVFNGDELVTVKKLDEEHMPAYPNGWEEWLIELEHLIEDLEPTKLNFYVGEAEYKTRLEEYFSISSKVTLVERSAIPVSATKIRNNPYEYWRYITKPFRRHFTKNVLVAGSASGGKTTLVKDLARIFNAPYSLEYARQYEIENNVTDEELVGYDYVHFMAGQYEQTSKIIDNGSHTGLVFADTNSTVTKAYYDYYEKDAPESERQLMEHLYEATVYREKWDLILFIMPRGKYVDDGFRDMTMADQNIRDEFSNHMLNLFERFGDKIVILDSDNAEHFYIENYEKAKATIKEQLGFEV